MVVFAAKLKCFSFWVRAIFVKTICGNPDSYDHKKDQKLLLSVFCFEKTCSWLKKLDWSFLIFQWYRSGPLKTRPLKTRILTYWSRKLAISFSDWMFFYYKFLTIWCSSIHPNCSYPHIVPLFWFRNPPLRPHSPVHHQPSPWLYTSLRLCEKVKHLLREKVHNISKKINYNDHSGIIIDLIFV